MDPNETVVNFTGLRKRYGTGPLVLEAIDLEIRRDDFVSFIGPSGCGKSTILKLVSGLSPASEGTVTVMGTKPRQARDRQAFIFQDATLLPWLTAEANVEVPLRIRGVAPEERHRRARAMLSLVGLDDARDYFPRQLSGGMKMRVSLARALTLSPQLLLLDEPFGALDEMTRNRLNEELLALRAQKPFTGMFVTHSVAEAVFLSNRIIVMAAHPGRFHAEVAVEFPYPRRAALREDPAFLEQVTRVSRLLHEVDTVVPV
ncbi:MAG TPA: ABC transporter ATP-binding protein [Candidatus Didemnitutus sp.]|nr:ABC transporter ATP-binding protein [Candidatus Didemnitutus sp.]